MWQIYAKHHLNDYCRNKVGQWLFFKDSSQAFGKKNMMIQEMLIKQLTQKDLVENMAALSQASLQ